MRLMDGVTRCLFLYSVLLVLPAIVASQPTECHIYDAQQPVREGWGAAYDVFSAEQELLLKATCTPDETHITVGNNNADTYIYHLGGQWINKKPEQIVLQCSGEKQGGAWCVGEATGIISSQSPYFAAYTCRKIDGSWKCGCRDTQCAQPFWQLQKVERKPNPQGKAIFAGIFGGGTGDINDDPNREIRTVADSAIVDFVKKKVTACKSGCNPTNMDDLKAIANSSYPHAGGMTAIAFFMTSIPSRSTLNWPGNSEKVKTDIDAHYNDGDRVYLTGHSVGGGDVQNVLEKLSKLGIPVATVHDKIT